MSRNPMDALLRERPLKRSQSAKMARGFGWSHLVIGALLVLIALMWVNDRDAGPGPTPIDGVPAVLFAVDGDHMNSLTVAQAQAANSAKIKDWCEEHRVQYRRYDVSDSLKREERQYQQMMDAAKSGDPPNMVIVDREGDGEILDIPEGVDETIDKLEEVFR